MLKIFENFINPVGFFVLIIVGLLFFLLGFLWARIKIFGEIKLHRQDAVKRSRASILWELYEKITPFLQDFEYSPKDMVFVGKWFDYLVLDWLNEWDLKEIIFLEIKYGSSTLNKNEKMIRQIVGSKKVKYVEFKIKK